MVADTAYKDVSAPPEFTLIEGVARISLQVTAPVRVLVPSTVKLVPTVSAFVVVTSPVRLLVPSTVKLVPTVRVFVVVTSPVRLLVPVTDRVPPTLTSPESVLASVTERVLVASNAPEKVLVPLKVLFPLKVCSSPRVAKVSVVPSATSSHQEEFPLLCYYLVEQNHTEE